MTAVELFDALAAGTVRMVWIACTNPAQSLPDQATVRAGLARAELVVLQEAYANTETAAFADVQLPASTWGEKEGTVTNSERRISRVRAAIAPPGEARADWAIAVDFARRLEARLRPGPPTLFPYESAAEIFAEHARIHARARPRHHRACRMRSSTATDRSSGRVAKATNAASARLYTDSRFATADGRARFAAVKYVPVAERVDARYPFRLNTGRLRDQWHGMSRTGALRHRSSRMRREPAVELNPADLARRGLAAGDLVRVESRRGNVVVPVPASEAGQAGHRVSADALGQRNARRAATAPASTRSPPKRCARRRSNRS